MSDERPAKRRRVADATPTAPAFRPSDLEVSLYVRWHSASGKSKLTHLQLVQFDQLTDLEGLSQVLVKRAYPHSMPLPDHLAGSEFYRFTPVKECLSLPGEVAETDFRLVVHHDGWEYPVFSRQLGAHRDPQRRLLVTVVEFDSTPVMLGTLGVRVSLIAYPVVCVKKDFLDGIQERLHGDPASFKGTL